MIILLRGFRERFKPWEVTLDKFYCFRENEDEWEEGKKVNENEDGQVESQLNYCKLFRAR